MQIIQLSDYHDFMLILLDVYLNSLFSELLVIMWFTNRAVFQITDRVLKVTTVIAIYEFKYTKSVYKMNDRVANNKTREFWEKRLLKFRVGSRLKSKGFRIKRQIHLVSKECLTFSSVQPPLQLPNHHLYAKPLSIIKKYCNSTWARIERRELSERRPIWRTNAQREDHHLTNGLKGKFCSLL